MTAANRLCIALAVMGAVAGGCARREERPLLEPLPAAATSRSGGGAGTGRINGALGSTDAPPPAQFSPGTPQALTLPPLPSGEGGGDISLDFVDTDIREVAAQILGTILGVNYTIDPAVRGTATLRTPRPLSRAQALATLQALLAQNGAALVQSGALYRVLPAAAASSVPGAAIGDALAGTTIVPLRYASAEDMARVLQPFVGNGGRIVADSGRNTLLVSGDPNARETLLGLIAAFDIDILAGQSYALFPVATGDARDFATALQEAFRSQGGGALAGAVRTVPMQRIGAVLVISNQPRHIEEARRVYTLVERARRATVRGWHVYNLQNSRSNDVAFVLQQAFTPRSVTAQPSLPGGVAPGRSTQQTFGGRGGGSSGGIGGTPTGGLGGGMQAGGALGGRGIGQSGGQFGGQFGGQQGGQAGGLTVLGAPSGQPSSQGASQGAAASANPLLGGLEPGQGQDSQPEGMRIIPSPQNNALLVYATPQERDTIERTLRRLDILPLQVRIDATIAEVTLNDQLQYGTQFFFRSGDLGGVLSTANRSGDLGNVLAGTTSAAAGAALGASFPGFLLTLRGNPTLAIQALQAVTDVRVLSAPQVVVMDNEPARLQVGQLVPFLTQSAQRTIAGNAPIVSSVDYRATGVIMEVTPRVNSGGLVTLEISQEVSDVAPGQTTEGINSPTFSQRVVQTRVAVQDGQTVGLAGLIRDNSIRDNQGLPWLSNVPLLGSLFSTQTNTRQRTELLVLITPRVIHDQRDARALTEDLRDQLPNAAALPGQLGSVSPSGSADPQQRVRRRLGLER